MSETIEIQKPLSPNSKNNTFNSTALHDISRFSNTSALDRLSHILSNNLRLDQIGDLKGNIPTIPINDLRGNEAALFSREERLLRCRLASLYRLLDLYGWTQSIYNHISVRCSKDQFLINPFGLLYHEVQASSLVKIDSDGNVVDPGTTVLGINKAGWTLHSALHSFRSEVDCVIHVHLPDVIAVSCLKVGLLPVCPEATELINHAGVKYHDYQGILVDEKERHSIQQDLGKEAKILFLRNHGVVIAARTVAEAWYLLKRVIAACQIQVRLLQQGGGSAYLVQVSKQIQKIAEAAPTANGLSNGEQNGIHDAASKKALGRRPFDSATDAVQNGDTHQNGVENSSIKSDELPEWTPVEKEFEAQMRILDSAGFCTGHLYRQPNLLRRGHYGPLADGFGTMSKVGPGGLTWGGDSTMHSIRGYGMGTLDILSDRTSAAGADLSGAEDYVASAAAAGQAHRAKINESVKAQRQKSGRNGPKNGTLGGVSLSNTLDSSAWDTNHTLYDDRTTTIASINADRSTLPATRSMFTDSELSSSTPMRTAGSAQKSAINGKSNAVDRTASLPQGTKAPGKKSKETAGEGRSSKTLQHDASVSDFY